MSRVQPFIFFLLLLALSSLAAYQILFKNTEKTEPGMVGLQLPKIELTNLFDEPPLSDQDLRGKISLLNIWASWCETCSLEIPVLLVIKELYHIPIYGIDYKDNPTQAKKWLKKYGNPYTKIGRDKDGEAAIDLGIYGTPETFIISSEGIILYHYKGMLDENVWENLLYPLIQQYTS